MRTITRKLLAKIFLVLIGICISVSGCIKVLETTNSKNTPTVGYELSQSTLVPKATMTFTSIPSYSELNPTLSDMDEYFEFAQIKVTQGPITVSTGYYTDNEYLYKDAVVHFEFSGYRLQGRRYLNLDDIFNNGAKNSDIILDLSTGSGGNFFQIYPSNYAKYYFADQSSIDFKSCIDKFPRNYEYSIDDRPSFLLGTGEPYCVLTNEGRMAIIYYVKGSDLPDNNGKIEFSLVVNVFRDKVYSLFTPPPTETPGPSPTPTNMYSQNGLTDEQTINLNTKIQEFINAVKISDINAISEMLDYPVKVQIMFKDSITLTDKIDFYKYYSQIFTNQFMSEVATAKIPEDVIAGALGLYVNGGNEIIYFTKEGKIREIDNYIVD